MCLKLKRVRASCIRLTNTAPAHSFYLSPKDAASWPQPPTDTQRSVCSSLLWFRCFAAAQHPVRPCTSAEVPSEKWNRELHHLWETLPPPHHHHAAHMWLTAQLVWLQTAHQDCTWDELTSFTVLHFDSHSCVYLQGASQKHTRWRRDAVVSAVTSQKQGCGFDSVGWCLCVAFACSPCTWMSTLYSAAVVVREFMKGLELKLTDCSLHTKLCLVHTMHRNDRRFYTAAGSQQAGGKKGGIQGEVDAAGRYVHRWGCENTFSRNSFQHWVHRRQRRAKIFIFHLNISPSLPSLRRRHSVWFRDMKQAVETAFRWSWSMSAGLTCRRLSVPHVVLSETEPDTPVSFHFYFLFVMNHKRERGSQQIRDTSYQI